ncbi:protein YceG [Candidatus Enterovibrio escicola]|uniref:Endolytic murein transglycosylase n=1 Tax=Candidatus Enterovibrio escicola TaxID=1927127 RepID=A0A2A5T2H2_9GAMM|nr:endolytic transglycosylase MltG [Candidatus Enterovibrio escacola]PCS22331.1 protein YceG [Candidatus Enterovibrio escacola]
MCVIKKTAIVAFYLVFAVVGSMRWVSGKVEEYVNAPIRNDSNVLFTVPEGANYHSVTGYLVSEGMVDSSQWGRWATKIYPELTYIKAGTYQLEPNMRVVDIFSVFRAGKEHQFAITFVEGSTFKEWLELLAKTDSIRHEMTSLSESEIAMKLGLPSEKGEGLFLPETYYFVMGDSDTSILIRALKQLNAELESAWKDRATGLPIKSTYELLTLASIIEKETSVETERGKVASVFVNRLNKRMRLQSDPTVIYGMGDKYDGNLRKKDLWAPTPYNTYVIFGLPPTPISMPSKASIIAAANPDNTPYFYFVADGLGRHNFSTTLTAHNRAVRQYLKTLKNK